MLSTTETSSATEVKEPQEPAVQVAPATTAPPPSEGLETPAPEQKVTEPTDLTPEQIETFLQRKDVRAKMYQQAQSMTDKRELQERLKRQQAEEARRRAGMDDEEYGGYTRAKEKEQVTLRQGVAHALGGMIDQMREQAASVISSKKERDEMIAKSHTFASFPDYVRACTKAEVEHQVGLKMASREKELTVSLTERIRADEVDQLYPDVGRGVASVPHVDLHGEKAIGAGIAAALAKKRKEG